MDSNRHKQLYWNQLPKDKQSSQAKLEPTQAVVLKHHRKHLHDKNKRARTDTSSCIETPLKVVRSLSWSARTDTSSCIETRKYAATRSNGATRTDTSSCIETTLHPLFLLTLVSRTDTSSCIETGKRRQAFLQAGLEPTQAVVLKLATLIGTMLDSYVSNRHKQLYWNPARFRNPSLCLLLEPTQAVVLKLITQYIASFISWYLEPTQAVVLKLGNDIPSY